MKSENSLLEELSFPSNYLSAFADVNGVIIRAHADGVYFRNDFHARLDNDQMSLRMDGLVLPLLSAEAIIDARSRLVGDQAEIITDESVLKGLLREFENKTRAMYWYLLWKYGGQTGIIRTQAGLSLFSVLGENGVYDIIQTPTPAYIQDFQCSQECDDCVEDDEDWEDEDDYDED